MRALRLFHFDIPTWGNFGDKALFPVVRDAFRVLGGADTALQGGADTALLDGTGSGRAEPRFMFTSAAALRREVDEAAVERINATADAVVIGGGGLFLQDTNPNHLSGWQWKISPEALAALEVPLIVYALGDNRFPGQRDFDELMRTHVGQVLDRSVFFGLRNTGSMATMGQLLGERDRIAFQPCPTTILDHLYAPLAGRRPDPTERTVAIQMLVHPRQIAAGYDAEAIHAATVTAARILVDRGWRVLSTPFHPDDAEVSRRLIAEVPGAEEVRLYGHDVGFFTGIELLSSVPYVLGGRGHAQMIPFGLGAIPISVDLHAKLGYFAADIGHPELVVPVEPEGMEADSAGGGAVGRAEALAERMVAAVEDAYASGSDLQADLADTRARFAEVTAENLAAISRSLRPRSGVGTHPAGDGGVRTSLADDGFVPPPATEDGRDDTSSTGVELRVWEDIRAEEFHVAAVCESEEVAAGQARDLVRTRRELAQARRELAQARREHQNAVSERASLQELSEDRLRQVEGERDEARTVLDRARDELTYLGQKITRGEQEKATLTGELARSAEALAAERNRAAGEEARVLAGKIRHGLQWRARRLARRLRNLGG
jgi:polysaccharide pyruvyl transferase WcaK-like protein